MLGDHWFDLLNCQLFFWIERNFIAVLSTIRQMYLHLQFCESGNHWFSRGHGWGRLYVKQNIVVVHY